jgi:peptide deformylase
MLKEKTLEIVTLNNDPSGILTKKTTPVNFDSSEDIKEAKEIIQALKDTLHHLLPAAGLAATQIGYSKSIFIFSWDRTEANLQVAINPTYTPIGDVKESRWEGCFSTILGCSPLTIAYVPRYVKIKAEYYNEEGKKITQILTNFAAKVFQHEYDHLQGYVNTQLDNIETKSFNTQGEMMGFMGEVKKHDQTHYIAPEEVIIPFPL